MSSIEKIATVDRISDVAPGAASFFKGLDIEHLFEAYSWVRAGRIGIERMAFASGGWG